MPKKLDFSMANQGQRQAVKARVFDGQHGGVYAMIDGGIFNGWEVSKDRLDEILSILASVRLVMGGVDAESST